MSRLRCDTSYVQPASFIVGQVRETDFENANLFTKATMRTKKSGRFRAVHLWGLGCIMTLFFFFTQYFSLFKTLIAACKFVMQSNY